MPHSDCSLARVIRLRFLIQEIWPPLGGMVQGEAESRDSKEPDGNEIVKTIDLFRSIGGALILVVVKMNLRGDLTERVSQVWVRC